MLLSSINILFLGYFRTYNYMKAYSIFELAEIYGAISLVLILVFIGGMRTEKERNKPHP